MCNRSQYLFHGNVAEAVGRGFAWFYGEKNEPDEAGKRSEVDKPPATAFAYVMHAAPAHGEHRHEEQDTQEVDKGDASHDKCKKKEPPVFSARCTTLEVYVLAKASLDGINEIHRFGTHLKVFICHDTDKFDWLGLFTLQIYEKYVNDAP